MVCGWQQAGVMDHAAVELGHKDDRLAAIQAARDHSASTGIDLQA
jgi:hypothetical protein